MLPTNIRLRTGGLAKVSYANEIADAVNAGTRGDAFGFTDGDRVPQYAFDGVIVAGPAADGMTDAELKTRSIPLYLVAPAIRETVNLAGIYVPDLVPVVTTEGSSTADPQIVRATNLLESISTHILVPFGKGVAEGSGTIPLSPFNKFQVRVYYLDGYYHFWREVSYERVCVVTTDGGIGGSKTTTASFTYTATDATGNYVYGTGMTPTMTRLNGKYVAGNTGVVVYAGGQWTLKSVNEQLNTSGC